MRIETLVDEAAALRPSHPALIFGERCWTYAQLRAEMDRRAAILTQVGLMPGDVVVTTENISDAVCIAFLACCRADLTFFPLSRQLTPAEMTPLIVRGRAAVILTADGQVSTACASLPALPLDLPGSADKAATNEVRRRSQTGSAEAIAILQTTSGTTGTMPKVVAVPHRTFTWLRATPMWWANPDAVHYYPYPTLFAVRGICDAMWQGGTIVLSQATDPQRMEDEMVARDVTAIGTVPAVLRRLSEHRRPPPTGFTLAVIRTVAAALPSDVRHAAERRYNATIVQEYASTEGGVMFGTPRDSAPDGSIGKPYPGVRARIVDEEGGDLPDGAIGELLIRTPGMMLGYRDDPAATARAIRDGWLWTGDLARKDADGCYYLEGRRTLRINVSGFKVAPEEVEAVLAAHPGVREVVVLAMPDTARGEVVRAVIVPEGAPPSASTLRRYCRERLAGYKVPRRFEFRDALPHSSLGKVLRHKL